MNISNLIEKTASNDHHSTFLADVINGLSAEQKSISAKYFYDDIGSELFQKISQHPDYYPTKTEFSILAGIADQLADIIDDTEIDIIELGAGDGHKSRLVIEGFLRAGRKVNFYPIDISEKAMHLLGKNLSVNNKLAIHGVVADYFQGLNHLKKVSSNKKLVLFLGSNIGNFDRVQTKQFLSQLHAALNPHDYVLLGFDLKKNTAVLNRAYNDADGLTKAFNLNLLTRINHAFGADFNLDKFQHYGFYNPVLGAMESYLISLIDQTVTLAEVNQSFHFKQFEAMHLEYSHKFTRAGISKLAHHNGFSIEALFADAQDYFIDALWQAS